MLSSKDYPNIEKINIFAHIRHNISCFYFHCTRTNIIDIVDIADYLEELIKLIIEKVRNDSGIFIYYLLCLYKMIGQCRDIYFGKGERDISYVMICVWYKYFPNLALYAFRTFTENLNNNNPYGCWSDVKYFCNFVRNYTTFSDFEKETMMQHIISYMLYQFDRDKLAWNEIIIDYLKKSLGQPKIFTPRPDARNYISNVAKWIPRESSKYGWLYDKIATHWHEIHNPDSFIVKKFQDQKKLVNKRNMIFRKEVARLSKEVNNVQTKQCDNEWKDIEPDKLTITTLFKNKFAFTKFDNFLYSSIPKDADRIETSFNFKDYFFNNGEPMKFKNHKSTHLSVGFFVKQGITLLSKKYTDAVCSQIDFLNKCWKKNVLGQFKKTFGITNMLPIADISKEISNDARNNSIGLGILIAQVSKIHRLILCEQKCYCVPVLYEAHFTDILREVIEYSKNAAGLNINNTINMLKEGEHLLENLIFYIFISDSSTIIEHQNKFLDDRNNFVQLIFWNIETTMKFEMTNIELSIDAVYLSGSSPSLLYYLNNKNYVKMDTFEYIGEILNTPRYFHLGCHFFERFIL